MRIGDRVKRGHALPGEDEEDEQPDGEPDPDGA
jgi:hypothetical protein